MSSYCNKEEKLHQVAVRPMQFVKCLTSVVIMLNLEEGIKNSEEMEFKIPEILMNMLDQGAQIM